MEQKSVNARHALPISCPAYMTKTPSNRDTGKRHRGKGLPPKGIALILKAANSGRLDQKDDDLYEVVKFVIQFVDTGKMVHNSKLMLDEERLAYLDHGKYLPVFFNTEIDRLRRCKCCQLIFWAKRKDQLGCSLRCSDILRKRKHRNAHLNKN